MNLARGYAEGWTRTAPSETTREYRRGYAEGREDRHHADLRRDPRSYQAHLGIGRSHRDWAGAWGGTRHHE